MFAIILINYVIQSTLFPHLAIMGITPDTALVFIVSYAILRGDVEGAIFGLISGLVVDILGDTPIGVFALLGFLTGFICGKPFRDFFKDNYFLPFFVVVGVSLIYQFVLYIVTQMFAGQLAFWHYFVTIILPKTVYTASLSIPVYIFLHFVNGKIERHEEHFRSLFNIEFGKDNDD